MFVKISIIVPIYNCEKYLSRCLNSLVCQTYNDLEIILINDGSLDKSIDICKEYKKKYNNIVIIDKKNQGVSAARNDGLKKATGEYLMFVDADDWLDCHCIELCVDAIKKYDVDVIMFPYLREYNNSSSIRKLYDVERLFKNKTDVESSILKVLIGPENNELADPTNMERLNSVWGKLYKTSIAKKINFIDFKKTIGEDLLFNIEYFMEVKSAFYFEKTNYHYNKVNYNSITKISPDNIYQRWNYMYSYIDKIIENNKDLIIEKENLRLCLNRRIAINLLSVIQQIYNTKLSMLSKYKEIKNLLNMDCYENSLKNIDIGSMSFKWQLYFYSCKYKFILFILFLSHIINFIKRRS